MSLKLSIQQKFLHLSKIEQNFLKFQNEKIMKPLKIL